MGAGDRGVGRLGGQHDGRRRHLRRPGRLHRPGRRRPARRGVRPRPPGRRRRRSRTPRRTDGRAHRALPDRGHARRPAHHEHLPRRRRRCSGPTTSTTTLVARAQVTYLEGYLFDRPTPRRPTARRRPPPTPPAARSRSRCPTRSASTATASDFRDLVADQVDILFANEDELMALYEVDDRRRGARRRAGATARSPPSPAGQGRLGGGHARRGRAGGRPPGRPRWSTPPAPATSTPPGSSTASPTAGRWPSAAGSARWPRPRSSPTSAPGRTCRCVAHCLARTDASARSARRRARMAAAWPDRV